MKNKAGGFGAGEEHAMSINNEFQSEGVWRREGKSAPTPHPQPPEQFQGVLCFTHAFFHKHTMNIIDR